jgi:predicted transport protein
MTKSPDEMALTMIANLKEKTGKSLEQWIAVAGKSGAAKHGEIVKMLKTDHGMTHGFANLVAHKTLKSDAGSIGETTDLVAAQYAGDKAALKPIYDALIKAAQSCGELEIAPKKAYVSLRRSKQFAIIQPSTKTRVDLGLNMKTEPAKGRLEKSGSFNAMVSHRVRLEKAADVDKDVKAWIKQAWSQG